MDVVTLGMAKADAKKKYAPKSPAAWFGSGDSIMRGAGDTDQMRGYFIAACERDAFGYLTTAFFGEKGSDFYGQRHTRLSGTEFTTHFLDEYGANDFYSGAGNASAATLETNALKRWQAARDRQQVVYAQTITPRVTTTSAYGTTAGQTVDTNEAARTTYNDWLRAGAPCTLTTNYPTPGGTLLAGQPGHPLTGYFETADTVESARNSGKWAAAARSFTDGAITGGTNTLTSATAAFTSADVGKLINVTGAGGGGAMLSVSINSVTNSTTAVLSNTASVTVSGAACAIDPYTADGVHPTAKGHAAMAVAVTLTAAVKANPPRCLREWIPMAYRSNGCNNGFSSGVAGGTSRVQHNIVPGYGYSAVRLMWTNIVGPYPGPNTLTIASSVEWYGKTYSATFNGALTGTMQPGQPRLLTDPISLDARSVAEQAYLYSRTFVNGGSSGAQFPLGLNVAAVNGEGHNYAASVGTDLTGQGWAQTPANPPTVSPQGVFSPVAILGKVSLS